MRVSCRWRIRAAAAAAVRPTTAAYDRGGSMETCEADGGGGGSRAIGGSGGGGRRGDGGCAGFAEAGGTSGRYKYARCSEIYFAAALHTRTQL